MIAYFSNPAGIVRQVACTTIDGRMVNITMNGRDYGDNLKMSISKLYLDKELTKNLNQALLEFHLAK